MPGSLLTTDSQTICAHGGQGQPTALATRVLVLGAPAVIAPPPWAVAGCSPPSGTSDVTASWSTATVRVTSMSLPLVFSAGSATCAGTGSPLTPIKFQMRVIAT